MRYLGICGVILFCLLIAGVNAAISVDAPTTVTRGGVVTDGDDVDGMFNISITGADDLLTHQWNVGFLINPQNLTGGYADRPPMIDEDLGINPTMVFDSYPDRSIGNTPVISRTGGQDFHRVPFYKLSPNGEIAPSNHPDVVYKMGTRYYGFVNGSISDTLDITIDTLYKDGSSWEEVSLRPGTYTFHVQDANYPTDDTIADGVINVEYGEFTLTATPLFQNVFELSGVNTDSKKTYLWITGEDLPECGTNLSYNFALPESGKPTMLGNYSVNGIISDIAVDYEADGTWVADWRIPATLAPGNYTIWASSDNPALIPNLSEGGWTNTKGVCGITNTNYASPVAKADIVVIPWEMSDPVIENSTIELDCCSNSVCSDNLTYPEVIVRGNLYINPGSGNPNGLPLQIWIFGPNKVGDRNLIFTNQFRTFPDDDSTYEVDITKFLRDMDISVCDLENGEYKVIVQMLGMNNGYLTPEFDVTHERSFASGGIPEFDVNHWYVASSHPYSKFGIYRADDNPGWVPAFPVEGEGSIGGMQAFYMLTDLLNQTFVRDQYKVVSFYVTNKLCGGSVDFTGTPIEGYEPLLVQFNDTSTYPGDSYNWTFGDGAVSNERNPVHLYESYGYYDVILDVWNGTAKKSATKSAYINVKKRTPEYHPPKASFTYLPLGVYNMTIRFIDQSFGSTPLTYSWAFGDNSTSDLQYPNHTFNETNTYNVSLLVTDLYGVTSTATQPVLVPVNGSLLYPDFDVIPEKGNPPLAVQIKDYSIFYPENLNVSYYWTIDGVQYGHPPVIKNPLFAGVHVINLTMTSPDGNSASTSRKVSVENVKANFTSSVNGTTISLTDTSEGFVTNWLWSIRDENGVNQLFTDRNQSTQATLRLSGTYQVTLTSWNDWNKDSKTESVAV